MGPSNEALNALRQAVIAQKTASLDERPEDPDLAEFYDSLVAYDAAVTQFVSATLQGRGQDITVPEDKDVETDLVLYETEAAPQNARLIRKYRLYKARLDSLLELAQQANGQTSQSVPQEPEPFEEVYVAAGELAGESIRIFLEANGFTVETLQESAGSAIGLAFGGLGAVPILVPASQATRARNLLAEMDAGMLNQTDNPAESEPGLDDAED